jgi:hypothetical protein
MYISDILRSIPNSKELKFREGFTFPEGITSRMVEPYHDGQTILFQTNLGSFYLSSITGNCGGILLSCLAVAYNADFKPSIKKLIEFGLALSEEMGYTQISYYATTEQEHITEHLIEANFTMLDASEFTNQRTNSVIHLYVHNIDYEEPEFEED